MPTYVARRDLAGGSLVFTCLARSGRQGVEQGYHVTRFRVHVGGVKRGHSRRGTAFASVCVGGGVDWMPVCTPTCGVAPSYRS